ncbi:LysR family transcriptional regulator [Parapusillimonas granuli]|uniref:LysR family transcriptional regulator n=1 Tax=Parapusillimonas granuli TaxID=380911 RepID=A0A853FXW3_9BURK|nr:LysR family transcriptional regulator [Parapusillimonas granuli]MBB5214645.1 DNA-binding transcriptional LysR family regulator [Parapusillimonas granuli]MEB2398107.1 LysR family transcriptional regulator [Alcaligenaceae bacterium]NYT48947.1 LysR family transcriptional regulator [Parapusillimonas granuli]
MRLEDLNYFLAVADTGHMGRASERLGQTQPALTKGIQRLERELGLQLFERTPKGMVLTAVGRAFFDRANQVQLALDEAVREAQDLHFGTIGLLRVGVPSIYTDYFARTFESLLRQRPAARVQVSMGLNDYLFSALRLGDLDLCISGQHALQYDEFEQEPLFQDDLYIVAREGHPLFFHPKLRFACLEGASWILPRDQIVARRWVDARFIEHGLAAPNVVVESNSSSTALIRMVYSTDLLTVATESWLNRPESKGLRAIPLDEARWKRVVGITTRKGAYLSPLVLRFIELLREHKPLGSPATR